MKKSYVFLLLLFGCFGLIGVSNAALWYRGGGLIYDDVLDILWLQNANLADTETFGVPSGIDNSGRMNWDTAILWIAAMNAQNYLGFSDWRLPDSRNADGSWPSAGYFNSSEMGHMYYENLGGDPDGFPDPPNPEFTDSNKKTVSFQYLMSYFYWSGTEEDAFEEGDALNAWDFNFAIGRQEAASKLFTHFVWPVRDGDVPAPATIFLLGSGLALLCVFRSRTRRRHMGDRVIRVIRSLYWVEQKRV